MLAWIQEYLSSQTFKVFFEEVYSEEHLISAGVPQGAVLSPTLFNVMMSDLPRLNNVRISEYADDLAVCCSSPVLQPVEALLQCQVRQLHQWIKKWGLTINPTKTQGTVFTRKSIPSPVIKVGDDEVAFVTRHKFLGILLDAPGLM
jgi:hypothetical protein